MYLDPRTIKASFAACTWALGRWTQARGRSLLGSFAMSTIMAASGEPLGAELLPYRRPDFRQVTGGCGCALEVDACPHIADNPGGLDLRAPGQWLLPLLRAICYPRAAHMSGYGCRSGRA